MSATFRWCSPCGGEQVFESPPCDDGHGEDCLDRFCIECGAAVVVGILLDDHEVLVEVRAA